MLREEVEQAEEQERKPRRLDGRPPPRRRLEDPLEARGRRRESHLGDAHGVGLLLFWSTWNSGGGKAEREEKVRESERERESEGVPKIKKRKELRRKTKTKKSDHRVQQPVLRLHLAVDSRGHRPQGPDALPQGVDAAVVLPLEGLRVGLLEEEAGFFRERERERKREKRESF